MATPRSRQACNISLDALNDWAEVFKCRRCLPAALSAVFGAILFRPVADTQLAVILFGVLLLACGCAGLNSVQERHTDSFFHRTCHRPLVTGRLNRQTAFWLSVLSLGAGLALLSTGTPPRVLPPLLGLAALLLYNGIYTPLKALTVLAILPGGLAGALPPLIGWSAAGGQLADPRAWMVFSLFFLWQIPHYCLIVLHYRQEYRIGPYPSLACLFAETTLQRIILLWILAFMVVALALAAVSFQLHAGSRCILTSTAILLCGLLSYQLLVTGQETRYRYMLVLLNTTFFTAITAVSLWQLFFHLADNGG